MEQKDRTSKLIDKYLAGKCTTEEKNLVERFYLDQFKKGFNPESLPESAVKLAMWNYINEHKVARRENRFTLNLGRLSGIAASLMLFILIGGYFVLHKKPPEQAVNIKTHDLSPGGNKAILTLANGRKLLLEDAAIGKLVRQGNASLTKVKQGQLEYQPSAGIIKPVFNTVTTPPGGIYQVVLVDGTKIWLDASSSVTFPTAFNGNDRTVEITGEAYFEVAHNAAKPFRVKSHGQTVEVLGTHFNINAYDDENVVKTTLLEGKVKVTTADRIAILEPGQQSLVANARSGPGVFKGIENVDTDEVVAWREGHFQFDRADLKTVMRQLARWYNVDIVYEGNIKPRLFSGSLSRNLSASKVLKVISYEDVHFIIDGNKIMVTP
jgi:transmembrane sensor